MQMVNIDVLKGVFGEGGADGCKRVLQFVRQGLNDKKFTAEQFSYKNLALMMGVIDPYDEAGSFREACSEFKSSENVRPEKLFTESNPGLYSNAFQVVTTELIASQVIAGYEAGGDVFIGDQLMTTRTNQRVRNQRIAGFTSVAGPLEVSEGHPYSESAFGEKWVQTSESKKGRILSINEELFLFDQTGEINSRAMMIGEQVRQERERTQVRAAIDADSNVWRPSGSATALYVSGNTNYIGSGGPTGFSAAVGLTDWTALETVLLFRATVPKDDRIDGTVRAIAGLNTPQNILVVPEKIRWTANHVLGITDAKSITGSAAREGTFGIGGVQRMIAGVYSSPFIDEVNGDDWYYGNFKKQFVYTEIWPVQTFTQSGQSSEAGFERDVAMRVKVRYYGGVSAIDKLYVTKIDGA